MEAIARNDLRERNENSAGADIEKQAIEATIAQVKEAHERYAGFGKTGEFTLARRDGDRIIFILRHRKHGMDKPHPVAFKSNLAEPMRLALSGRSGTVIGLDYLGETVLAAYEPVAILNLGIVAKIDLAEVREPFIRAAAIVAAIALVVVAAGARIFFGVTDPMIRLLKESQQRLSNAHRLAGLGNWEWDIVNDKFYWSEEALRIYGANFQKSVETREAFLKTVHPDDRDDVARAMDHASCKSAPYSIGRRFIRQDNEVRFVHEEAECECGSTGNPVSVKGTVQDITKRVEAENALRETEEVLRRAQRMESVGQLAGGIAHDFNNLLGIMIGNLDILEEDIEAGNPSLKQVRNTQKAALRGADLTRGLLAFSRQSVSAASPVNVNKVIEGMQPLLAKSLTVEVVLETSLADGLWLADMDPGELEDALINFALNARDTMPGGGKLIIETENKALSEEEAGVNPELEPGEYVMISVSDTGTGMPKEVVERIFEPFYSTKGKGKGTGLGLAMVYSFVKRAEGMIKVYSSPDRGTTFRVYLPRSEGNGARTALPETGMAELPGGTETVLVIDDEEELLELAERNLKKLGYRVLTAKDGAEGLRILEGDEEPDLLFSDVVMPGGLNGFELALHAIWLRPRIKVLLTSGFTAKLSAELIEANPLLKTFADRLLAKPYTKSEFATRIRQTLDTVIRVPWSDDLVTGVEVLDEDRKALIRLLNEALFIANGEGASTGMENCLDSLVQYTLGYFKHEEAVMKVRGHPNLDDHMDAHRRLTDKAESFVGEFKKRVIWNWQMNFWGSCGNGWWTTSR